jgi:hypothetical protein
MGNFVRPARVYDFTAFSRRTPAQQLPGDRVDAQFTAHADAIAELQAALGRLDEAVSGLRAAKEATLGSPSLYVNAGGPYAGDDAGATATSADYAQVSIEWAEHMPDTIPPNILAINAISGAHWSSRWWANRATQIVTAIGAPGVIPGTQGVFAESVAVTGTNACADLTHTPAGPVLLIVNGMAFLPVGSAGSLPFLMSGKTINWLSLIYSLIPGQSEVAAWYPYAP